MKNYLQAFLSTHPVTKNFMNERGSFLVEWSGVTSLIVMAVLLVVGGITLALTGKLNAIKDSITAW